MILDRLRFRIQPYLALSPSLFTVNDHCCLLAVSMPEGAVLYHRSQFSVKSQTRFASRRSLDRSAQGDEAPPRAPRPSVEVPGPGPNAVRCLLIGRFSSPPRAATPPCRALDETIVIARPLSSARLRIFSRPAHRAGGHRGTRCFDLCQGETRSNESAVPHA